MRALLVLSIFLLCSCGKPRSFYVPPAADDVIEISVSFFDPDAAVPSVIERVMTEEQTQDFLKSVSMGYRDREPRKWQVMGDLFMKTRSEEDTGRSLLFGREGRRI